jgi:hypothetical protein
MIQDYNLIFGGAAKAITGTAGTRIPLGGDTGGIDLGAAGDNVGPGELELVIQVSTSVAATGGAANVTFSLETKSANSAWVATAGTVLWKSAAIAKGTLVAGYTVCRIRVPKGMLRYLQVVALPDTNDTTTGKVEAFLTPASQYNDMSA